MRRQEQIAAGNGDALGHHQVAGVLAALIRIDILCATVQAQDDDGRRAENALPGALDLAPGFLKLDAICRSIAQKISAHRLRQLSP